MTSSLYKKGLVLGIIILFVGTGVVPGISGDIIETVNVSVITESTIYVDDDNTEGPWDGTLEHPYQYIQDGIDNADNGDTVFVYGGTYYENVIINKSSINLVGENPVSTIIDSRGVGTVIHIAGYLGIFFENIKIEGFTIQNGSVGIYVSYSDNTIIYNNIVRDTRYGIRFWHTEDEFINDNIIIYNSWGIYFEFSDHSTIQGNYILNGDWGIGLVTSDQIDIHHNEIKNNSNNGIVAAFELTKKEKIHIHHNNFIDNSGHATFENCRIEWNDNYWDTPSGKIIPIHVIWGVWYTTIFPQLKIPWPQFDLRCASTPYDI